MIVAKASKGDQQMEAAGRYLIQVIRGMTIGATKMFKEPAKFIGFIIVILICSVIFYLRELILEHYATAQNQRLLTAFLQYGIWLLPAAVLYFFGTAESARNQEFHKKFEEIKFCGRGGGYPEYLRQEEDGEKTIYEFKSIGLTVQDWKARKTEIETALDCNILSIKNARHSKQKVLLETVSAEKEISHMLPWSNDIISKEDFQLVIGESLLEKERFDLNKYPHVLIAGVTGSGKSVILRGLLWQCIYKGARVHIADFKGGVEFSHHYEQFADVVTDRQATLELLKELVQEMEDRNRLFKDSGVKNLPEYNEKHPDSALCRVVLGCDEIAEMLDKTGLSKADREIYSELEKELSTLARQGRGAGINMLLATQRPDAKVLVGQIKNNLPVRISGRMTDVQASEMVLGNTAAAALDDTLGRFLYNVGADTYEFQAYNFQDSYLMPGDWQKGRMLSEMTDETIETTPEPEQAEPLAELSEEPAMEDDNWTGF